MSVITVATYMLIKCRRCGERLIARDAQQSKACPACATTFRLHYTNKGANTRELRVVVLARFATFKEASDALRYIKLPSELRDPRATELYHATMW